MVEEGGSLKVQWQVRGALCGLKEHLTVPRGAGVSEGTKLPAIITQKQTKWHFSAVQTVYGKSFFARQMT